jgi:hypothetical protein
MQIHKPGDAAGAPILRNAETIALFLGAAAFLGFFLLGMAARGRDPLVYLRDPSATFGFPPLAGFISTLGVFAMVGAGVICILCMRHGGADRQLLGGIGVLSLAVAADDFFMFHEGIGPNVLGVPESVVFLAYAAGAGWLVFRFPKALLGRAHLGLYASLVLLGLSVWTDRAFDYGPTVIIFEDGFKFVGLVLWSAYWVRRADLSLTRAILAASGQAMRQRAPTTTGGRMPAAVAGKSD